MACELQFADSRPHSESATLAWEVVLPEHPAPPSSLKGLELPTPLSSHGRLSDHPIPPSSQGRPLEQLAPSFPYKDP